MLIDEPYININCELVHVNTNKTTKRGNSLNSHCILQTKNMSFFFRSAVSHIPQFGDASSPAGDVDMSEADAHL